MKYNSIIKVCFGLIPILLMLTVVNASEYAYETFNASESIIIYTPAVINRSSNDASSITDATCLFNLTNPSDTQIIENGVMNHIGNGRYKNITEGLTDLGVYHAFIKCSKGSYEGSSAWDFRIVEKYSYNKVIENISHYSIQINTRTINILNNQTTVLNNLTDQFDDLNNTIITEFNSTNNKISNLNTSIITIQGIVESNNITLGDIQDFLITNFDCDEANSTNYSVCYYLYHIGKGDILFQDVEEAGGFSAFSIFDQYSEDNPIPQDWNLNESYLNQSEENIEYHETKINKSVFMVNIPQMLQATNEEISEKLKIFENNTRMQIIEQQNSGKKNTSYLIIFVLFLILLFASIYYFIS